MLAPSYCIICGAICYVNLSLVLPAAFFSTPHTPPVAAFLGLSCACHASGILSRTSRRSSMWHPCQSCLLNGCCLTFDVDTPRTALGIPDFSMHQHSSSSSTSQMTEYIPYPFISTHSTENRKQPKQTHNNRGAESLASEVALSCSKLAVRLPTAQYNDAKVGILVVLPRDIT